MINRWYLIFEDLLDQSQKSVAGPFEAETREQLAERFGLKKRTIEPKGKSFPIYWDKTTAGEVLIYMVLASDPVINTPEDLGALAFRLQCDWY